MNRLITTAVMLGLLSGCGGGEAPPQTQTTGQGSRNESSGSVANDCHARGITSAAQDEGTCTANGVRLTFANRAGTLRLPSLNARLIQMRESGAGGELGLPDPHNGSYLIFELAITNKTRSSAQVEQGQIFLVTGSNRYTEDLAAERKADQQSFLVSSEHIQPGATVTGHVVFDLPASALRSYKQDGNLFILPFEANRGRPTTAPRGLFRTYQ